MLCLAAGAQDFRLNDSGYFNHEGVDAMAFDDFYPEGHQGGISFIMNGKRVATNGDIRFDETPGQWQPVPKKLSRTVEGQKIVTRLCYPDSSRHETGFNPTTCFSSLPHWTFCSSPACHDTPEIGVLSVS